MAADTVDVFTEQRYFWRAVRELRETARCSTDGNLIYGCLDEIASIGRNTQSDLIRRRCARVLTQYRPFLFGYARS